MNKYKKDIATHKRDKKILKQKIKQSTVMGNIFKAILLSVLCVIFVFIIAHGFFLYNKGIRNSNLIMEEEANTISSRADNYFNSIHNIFNMLSAHSSVLQGANDKASQEFVLQFLAMTEQYIPNINQISIGYENNTILVNAEIDSDSYVVTERPWYKEALSNPDLLNVGISYYSERKGQEVIAASKAIQDNGKIIGVVSVDCKLDSLYTIFKGKTKFKSKSVFMASPKSNSVLSKSFSEIDTKLINNYPEILHKETNYLNVKLDNKKYLVYSHPLANYEWTLITRIDYSEIVTPVFKKIGRVLFLLVPITLIISYTIAKTLSKSIAGPVIEVSSALSNFAKGDEEIQPIEVKQNNEIGLMAKSFNTFIKNTEKLKSDIRDLESVQNSLNNSLSLVNASLESTNDGILIIDNDNIAQKWNKRLLEIWEITALEVAKSKDELLSLKINNMIVEISETINPFEATLISPEKSSLDILKLDNGRVVERSSFPQKIEDKVVGRVWRFKDITEKKKIEAELIIREQNFREFFESMKDMVFIADFKANIVYTNKSTTTELGYSFEELTTMSMFDLYIEEFIEEARFHLENILNGKRVNVFTPLMAKNGNKIPTNINVWLGKWNKEDLVFMLVKNISKEQEALIKFNRVFQSNPSAMALTSYPENTILDVNEMFCKMLGLKKEEVIGKSTADVDIIAASLSFNSISQKLLKENSFKDFHVEIVARDGKKIDGLFAGELIEIGSKSFYLTVMLDITEEKKLNRELRESEQRYRLLFENMSSGFALHEVIYDETGNPVNYKFLAINPALREMLGGSEKDFIGKTVKEVLPQTDGYWIEIYGKVAKSGKMISFERYSETFGKYFEIKAFSPEQDRFATLLTDITERKNFLDALEKEKEIAQAATEAKSEFLANMTHEIRTPLNGVIGFTDLLLQTQLNQTQQQYAINANISGKSLLGIINDVLDFSKIESGRMELDFINANLREIIEQTTDIVKFSACEKGLDFIIDIPVDFPEVAKVDSLRLRQILLNLLNNAIKFTHEGDVELSVRFTPKGQNRGAFTFTIKDTGIGIAKNVSSKLFKAFSQADGSITRKYGGTGLGLVISNFFATKMGSHIEFESEVGVGSKFFFTIEADYLENSYNFKNTLTDNKILVVEKNQKIIDAVQHYLEHWGMQIDATNDCKTALKKLDSKGYDVLLIDFRMLKCNNSQLSEALKNRDKATYEHQTIIISYCPGDTESITKEKKHLLDKQMISKPIVMKNLHNLLNKAYNNKNKLVKKEKRPLRSHQKALLPEHEVNILIAEDVEMNMKLIKTLVTRFVPKATIYEATNGQEAIDLYKKHKTDLILMDIQMPVLDGLEATAIIKEYESTREESQKTPIVALTAGAFCEDRDRCFAAGMLDFLAKPIVVKELIEVLEKYLSE